MDLKSIIREMLNAGMSESQIKDNLKELGIEDPDTVFAQAVDQMKPVSTQAVKPEPPKKPAAPTASEPDEEKPLFSDSEKPGFSFTRVSNEGEKEETVLPSEKAKEMDMAQSAVSLMKPMAQTSLTGDLDTVEQKLDQTIALLKALQEINQKILQSQRDVLLRLK